MLGDGLGDVDDCLFCKVWLKDTVLRVGISWLRLRSLRCAAEVRSRDCIATAVIEGLLQRADLRAGGEVICDGNDCL